MGWCGGEYAFENFMHQDLQTLRSQILVPELDCHQAQLDGTIKLSTPEYGSIQGLDLMLELAGGRGQAMFQPIGFSRPDSWCRGSTFYPPINDDKSIVYLDYESHFERKKMWGTDRIRRAVVTYNLEATVEKVEGFITSSGNKLIVPNKLEINRRRNIRREKLIDRSHYKNIGMKNNINSLEAYRDLAYGTIVFNITGLPRSECEAFRSVTKINNGELLKSKLEDFSILKYSQGEDSVAITLNKNTRICGKKMFETKIKNIFVVILENQEEYLENKKLQIAEYDRDVLYSAELRAALNSVELSTDSLYTDINHRICLLQRQQILLMQAMLSNQMEVLQDEEGNTVYTHAAGEVSKVHKCKKILARIREGDEKCCEELAVWVGEKFERAAYMKAVSRQVTSVCTPRVCSVYNSPWFNIGSEEEDVWVKVEDKEIIMAKKPKEIELTSHNKEEELIMSETDIFDDGSKEKFRIFSFIHQTRKLIEGEVVQRMYPAKVLSKLNDESDIDNNEGGNFVSYRLQDAFLPWPLNYFHILPDWLIITILGVIGLILLKVIMDPMLACLTLVGDSSLSIIQRLSSIIVPATTVSWIHNKNTPQVEQKEMEDVEFRISELEDQMQLFRNVMVRNVNFNASKKILAEESV